MKRILFTIAVFAFIALQAGTEKTENLSPYVFIPEIKTAPVLDGNLDEECWKNAARLAPFMLLNSDKRAENQTEAYIAHDDKNLYIAARCYAKVLDADLQMLDKFKAEKKERDSGVFSDDSIEIFIAPDKKQYFHFAANSLGTQYDGIAAENSWNGEWTARASVKEKFWEIEIAIPFSEIKMSSGQSFYINICRNEKADNEYSSWVLLDSGFHSPEKFGKAEIGKTTTAQILSAKLPSSPVPTGTLKYKFDILNNQETSKNLRLDLVFLNKDKRELKRLAKNAIPHEISPFEISYDILKADDYKYSYILTDSTNGNLLYRSPFYSLKSNILLSAENKISYTGKCRILLNGKELKNKHLDLEGVNIIEAECEGPGILSGGTAINDFKKSLPEMIEFSGTVKGGERKTFTQKILVESTEIFPVDVSKGLNIAKGTAQKLPFVIEKPVGKELEILLPEGMEFIDFKDDKKEESFSVSINGKEFKKYVFKYMPTTKIDKYTLGTLLKTNGISSGKAFYFRTKSSDMIEAWNRVPVNVSAPLLNKRPRKIRLELCHSFGVGEYTEKQIDSLLETYSRMGFNSYYERTVCYGNKLFADAALKNKMNVSSDFNMYILDQVVKAHPEAVPVNMEGKRPHYLKLKPSFFYGKGRQEVVDTVKNYVKGQPCNEYIMDFEASPFGECDVSEESLNEFARFAKIDKVQSVNEIKEKYSKEWIDFMAWSWTRIGEVLKEGIKAGNPDAKFGVYSSYQSPENKARYSIDWSYWKNIVDFAEMGYGRPPLKIREETFAALGEVPCYTGVLFYQDMNPSIAFTLKNAILRRITDGADGIMFFNSSRLDGISSSKISEAAAILADHEEFFLKKKRDMEFQVSGDVTVDDVVLLESDGKYLLLVFNDTKKLKKGTVKIKNTETPVTLEAWDAAVFRL